MKTVQLANGTIKRVSDEQAQSLVTEAKAIYVKKSVWKEKVRDAN